MFKYMINNPVIKTGITTQKKETRMKKIVLMMVAALTALSFSMVAVAAEPKKEEAKPAVEKADKKDDKKVDAKAKKDDKKKDAKPKKQLSGC